MTWPPLAGGSAIGGEGSESDTILRDEEFCQRARITLEKEGKNSPFTITCGSYGWLFHTRDFAAPPAATAEYDKMKAALSDMLGPSADRSPTEGDSFSAAIAAFVSRFP